jgi:phage gp16-like protein
MGEGRYIPSTERRRKSRLTKIERENIHLRQRLSAMRRELERANAMLKEVQEWRAWVNQAAKAFSDRVVTATNRVDRSHIVAALEREEAHCNAEGAASERASLHIADLRYSIPLASEVTP